MTQITEDFVSYETAKLLKEKEFVQPEICQCQIYGPKGGYEITEDVIYAPTQALAMKWLREVHKIEIRVIYDNEKLCWYGACNPMNELFQILLGSGCKCKSYEEAAEAGIRYCLENLI